MIVEKQKKKKKKKDDVDDSQEPAKTDAATREAVMSTHTACLGWRAMRWILEAVEINLF